MSAQRPLPGSSILSLFGENDKKAGAKSLGVRLGDDTYEIPIRIEKNEIARSEFWRIIHIYMNAGLKITSSSDVNAIARYCEIHSEYLDLLSKQRPFPNQPFIEYVGERGHTRITASTDMKEWDAINTALTQKRLDLNRLEDKLLLNPLTKARSINFKDAGDTTGDRLEQIGLAGV